MTRERTQGSTIWIGTETDALSELQPDGGQDCPGVASAGVDDDVLHESVLPQ